MNYLDDWLKCAPTKQQARGRYRGGVVEPTQIRPDIERGEELPDSVQDGNVFGLGSGLGSGLVYVLTRSSSSSNICLLSR